MQQQEKRQHDDVSHWLAQAEQQRQAGKLTRPLGDNAYESYRQVLRLDPANPIAKQGVAGIVAHYEQQAQQHKEEDETILVHSVTTGNAGERPVERPSSPAQRPAADHSPGRRRTLLLAVLLLVLIGAGLYLFWPLQWPQQWP